MAMYENRGFCPSNSFTLEEMRGNTSYFWNRTRELLGDRIGYMVYDDVPKGNGHGYFVDALTHATGTLGIEVAAALKTMIPECHYANAEVGLPIVLKDVDGLPSARNVGDVAFEDNRYMVVLNECENSELEVEIHVYTYKK